MGRRFCPTFEIWEKDIVSYYYTLSRDVLVGKSFVNRRLKKLIL